MNMKAIVCTKLGEPNLLEIQEIDKGKKILNSLIDNNSNFRLAAEDIIK